MNLFVVILMIAISYVRAATQILVSGGSFVNPYYKFNGNYELPTLVRGQQYTFIEDGVGSSHPFNIGTGSRTNKINEFPLNHGDGRSVTITVPSLGGLYYWCKSHPVPMNQEFVLTAASSTHVSAPSKCDTHTTCPSGQVLKETASATDCGSATCASPADDNACCEPGYSFGLANITLCPDDSPVKIVWAGKHNIQESVSHNCGSAVISEPLAFANSTTLDGDVGFLGSGTRKSIAAKLLSDWDSKRYFRCSKHCGGARLRVTCDRGDPYYGKAKQRTKKMWKMWGETYYNTHKNKFNDFENKVTEMGDKTDTDRATKAGRALNFTDFKLNEGRIAAREKPDDVEKKAAKKDVALSRREIIKGALKQLKDAGKNEKFTIERTKGGFSKNFEDKMIAKGIQYVDVKKAKAKTGDVGANDCTTKADVILSDLQANDAYEIVLEDVGNFSFKCLKPGKPLSKLTLTKKNDTDFNTYKAECWQSNNTWKVENVDLHEDDSYTCDGYESYVASDSGTVDYFLFTQADVDAANSTGYAAGYAAGQAVGGTGNANCVNASDPKALKTAYLELGQC